MVLDIAALTGPDPELGCLLWLALQAVAWSLLVPAGTRWHALARGTILALGTAWGLLRHYWVIFKLVLTLMATLVLLLYTQTISTMPAMASDPAMAGMEFPTALLHTGDGLVVRLLATILAVYTPKGITRYGQRKRLEQRKQVTP